MKLYQVAIEADYEGESTELVTTDLNKAKAAFARLVNSKFVVDAIWLYAWQDGCKEVLEVARR